MLLAAVHGEQRQVHIVAVNDMHATIDVFPQFAALVDSLRGIDPSLLVLSAGDNRTGNPLNDRYVIPAYPMVALMNQVGFNASALGNHEFDVHSLARLIQLSNFRYLCANIFAADSTGIRTLPYQTFDVGGVRVGIIGAIQLGESGLPSTHPDNLKGVRFSPPMETIGQYEWISRECDVTVLLSHLGYETDVEVAKAYPWLDLIVGGHTHTQLKGNEKPNGVLITQNKNKFGRVTYITLTVDSGQVIDKKAEYIDVKKFPRRNGLVASMVKHFSDTPRLQQVVGHAAAPFEVREELGCMMCDAFIEAFVADIGVENPGGVRIDTHPEGDITLLDVLQIDPFDNNAVVLELTGEELLRMMLTYSNSQVVRFPYVGGMQCQLKTEKDNPAKIKSVKFLTLNGKKFDMKRKYRVVTNNYVLATSKVPEGAAQVQNVQTTDVIVNFLGKHKDVNYRGVRRIRIN